MNRRVIIGAVMFGVSGLGSVRTSLAQTIDIPALAGNVVGAEPEDLLDGLRAPIRESLLPRGFATIEEPDEALQQLADTFDSIVASITENEGTATHLLEVERSRLPSTFGNAIVSYLVLDQALDANEFTDLAEDFPDKFANRDGDDAELGVITIGGSGAVRLYSTSQDQQTYRDVMIVAVPIGTVVLFATVLITNRQPIDDEDLDTACLDLAMAGAGWLAAVVNELA